MTDHRYQGYAHPELYKMINSGPGVAASIPVEQGWKQIAATLAQIDADLHTGLTKMGAGWESDAADSAQGALSPLAQWAGFAETGATTMESSARLQGEYIAEARKKMPEVVPVTTEKPGFLDYAGGALTGPLGMAHVIGQQQDHERQEAAADNAAAQAVKVMEDYQSDSRWNSSTLGEFPTPPQVVIDTPPPGDTGTGNTRVGFTPSDAGLPTGHNTTTPSWTGTPTQTSSQQVSTGWTPPPTDTTHTSWTQPPTTTPPPTYTPPPTSLPQPTPTPTPTPLPGGPVFTRPGTGGPGGPGGTKGAGGPGGSGGTRAGQLGSGPGAGKAFGSMSGSLGSSGQQAGAMKPGGMPGGMSGMGSGPDAMRGGAAGAGAGAGKAGAAGAAGAGGGAHGQRSEGEEDIEHKAADYLVETDDVFGDERMVAPPVIGGLSE
ncbi:PPE domain-containing protein [Lentzea flaviverrucosa]|uniref:PPE family protein n=1 Tax=Lentzea flaviverrucosa TaxID=200379 RepID=A0A1H9PLX0_9PSEU|nr:PPE domain-containing protein [Lentzea flaviverrucosa]RDI29810.1 PPE family protein [Lentzea flaviverrucosa]SER48789.1 PPE family protein [Lentzea flaviverrucosa]